MKVPCMAQKYEGDDVGKYILGFRYDCDSTAQVWVGFDFFFPLLGTPTLTPTSLRRATPKSEQLRGHRNIKKKNLLWERN